MSRYEAIQIVGQIDAEKLLDILQRDYGARPNPHQAGTYWIDDPPTPFYPPTQFDGYLCILGFNHAPLSELLLRALVEHPDIIPQSATISWLEEQEVIATGTAEELAQLFADRSI